MNRTRIRLSLVVGAWALALIVLAAYAPAGTLAAGIVSFDADLAPMSTYCSDVVNPDLVALDRNYGTFAGEWYDCALQGTQAAFLAANPELMAANRYAGSAAPATVSTLLASNPELMVAQRYTVSALPATDSAFLATNPELMAASRYVG